jgi:predicted nucleotidyltransferase component of viral defense system
MKNDEISRTPLHWKIKRKQHREIARLQDMVMEAAHSAFERCVLHGGTAIWRCYSGNRFSEDIDVYIEKNARRLERFFEMLRAAGFEIIKKRIKENSVYSLLRFGRIEIRFEAVFKKISGSIMTYETYEGNLINIYTLTPEELIAEKTDAYLKRRKIRDLYDIFFLARYAKKDKKIIQALEKLFKDFTKPADEEDLKVLILSGATPGADDMLDYIKRWAA